MTDHFRGTARSGLVLSLTAVVLLTLTPTGRGWVWADPIEELLWYLSDPWAWTTFVQWAGNLTLLAAPIAFAVIRLARAGAFSGPGGGVCDVGRVGGDPAATASVGPRGFAARRVAQCCRRLLSLDWWQRAHTIAAAEDPA